MQTLHSGSLLTKTVRHFVIELLSGVLISTANDRVFVLILIPKHSGISICGRGDSWHNQRKLHGSVFSRIARPVVGQPRSCDKPLPSLHLEPRLR